VRPLSPTLRRPLLSTSRPAIIIPVVFKLLPRLRVAHAHKHLLISITFFERRREHQPSAHIVSKSKFFLFLFFPVLPLTFTFRHQHTTDPESVKWKWSFSGNTGNSSLRSHLESLHKDEYLQLCEEKGWTIMLPKMRKAAKSAIGDNPGGPSAPHPPFSQSQLLKALVNFIVADDQIRFMPHQYIAVNHITFQSINIVECCEFRDLLLLLHEDL
jgi:hypothetical protein